MNNNEILNEILNGGEACTPSDKLNPMSIENSLSGVKRKSNKSIIGTCVTLGIICLTAFSVFGSGLFGTTPPISTTTQSQLEGTEDAESYSEIFEVVNSIKEEYENSYKTAFWSEHYMGGIDYGSVADVAESATATGSTESSSGYSDTNIQVEGVDEADVVKTDGTYIYQLSGQKINIAIANNGNPEYISTINTGVDVFDSSEMYIHNNLLIVTSEVYNSYSLPMSETADTAIIDEIPYDTVTAVFIYDLSDISAPKLISTLSQMGNYTSSRKIGDTLYLTSSYSIYNYYAIEKSKPYTYCPVYGTNDGYFCVDSERIIINENTNDIEYLTVSSIDLNNPTDFADMRSVLGSGSEMYSSLENLYIAASNYSGTSDTTKIFKFALDGSQITPLGETVVMGSVLNQFAMDEYNGYFRIVTETTPFYTYMGDTLESSSTQTALYVYDITLNLVGKTDNVAPNEHVKSVRFDGDTAYFVTFRQTDPLFTVDLSDPTSPQILSELKIPGFSEYLHVFGDGLLLGFGREADIETGRQEGLKLTMFDTSDKTNVTEIATRILTDENSYSDGENNHKAIFIDEERKLIGIPCGRYYYSSEYESYNFYLVYEYDEENEDFILREEISLSENDFSYDYFNGDYARGLYIGDYFYIVTPNTIYTYDYETFEQISEISRNTVE